LRHSGRLAAHADDYGPHRAGTQASSRRAFLDYRQALGRCAFEKPLGSQPSVSSHLDGRVEATVGSQRARGMGSAAALVSPPGLPYPKGGRRRGSDAAQSVRLASRVRKGRRFTSLVRKWAARPMTTAVATRRVRITAKKWNRALETFPEAAAIPRTGTRLRPSRVARMAPMRREPFALAAPSASGVGALALRFSRDLEPIS